MARRCTTFIPAAVLCLLFAGCSDSSSSPAFSPSSSSSPQPGHGEVRVLIHDAPTPQVAQVVVTIDKVLVKSKAEAVSDALGITLADRDGSRITAPGQLASHYAPRAGLRLNADAPRRNELWLGFGPDPRDVTGGLSLSPV